jgi:hypothetical protein
LTEYDKQGLAAYKAFDDYRLFEEGYVESLVTKPLPMIGVHLYMGKVRPSMKKSDDAEGKAFYELWFILEGRGASRGTVLKAFCTCKREVEMEAVSTYQQPCIHWKTCCIPAEQTV